MKTRECFQIIRKYLSINHSINRMYVV